MVERSVRALVSAAEGELTEGQRKVAALVTRDPEAIAFGTAASVAVLVGTSGPTVVRFAMRLGYSGFAELQDALRAEVAQRARTARGRIHRPDAELPALASFARTEAENVERTFAGIEQADLDQLVDLIADVRRSLWILPSVQTLGPATTLTDTLAVVRGTTRLVHGSDLRLASQLGLLQAGDLLMTIDIQRHERQMLRLQHWAVSRGALPIVLTNQRPSAFDTTGGLELIFSCDPVGPLESLVGLVALGNAIVAAVASKRRPDIDRRLDHLEQVWDETQVFGD
jgi:DNA-binding MurR/RpiR family transcriptional regulator